MANIASQKKRIVRTERERIENRRLTSAVKTQFRALEEAAKAGSGDAESELKKYASRVDKAVQKGALHRNTGARKKARATRLLKQPASS
jgi:small subunit ribosomal protein S20